MALSNRREVGSRIGPHSRIEFSKNMEVSDLTIQARLIPTEGHTRAHDRFELQMEIRVQILIPEETFRPHEMEGLSVDISATGIKVRVREFPTHLYRNLLARTRHIRISFDRPDGEGEVKLTGKVAWIDFARSLKSREIGQCDLGVFFCEGEGVDMGPYLDFVNALVPMEITGEAQAESA